MGLDSLAAIEPILQCEVERAAADRLAAPAPTRSADPALAGNAASGEFLLQRPHRAELGISAKYVSDVSASGSTMTSFRSWTT